MRTTGQDFDFISCHGVLSYIPHPARVLRNLARSLAPDGALYLGVNGEHHFSVAWRRVLTAFGYDPTEFADGPALRRLLKLCDALAGNHPDLIATQESEYLAGDLFGALNHRFSLQRWNRMARRAGLHCCGGFAALASLRPALNGDLHRQLMPRSRANVAEILDWLDPSDFHRLVFKRSAPPDPPWLVARAMLDWRPKLTPLYVHRWPKLKTKSGRRVRLEFRSQATNALVEMHVPGWELACLRHCDGSRSLRQILAALEIAPPLRALLDDFYLLHQFAVLNLLPPSGD